MIVSKEVKFHHKESNKDIIIWIVVKYKNHSNPHKIVQENKIKEDQIMRMSSIKYNKINNNLIIHINNRITYLWVKVNKIYNNNLIHNKYNSNINKIKISRCLLYVHNVDVSLFQILNSINNIFNNQFNNK